MANDPLPAPPQPLTAKEQHLMDVYDSLGVKWGDDPFAFIANLKSRAVLGEAPHPDLRGLLAECMGYVAAASCADHFMDGFKIGADGLPRGKKSPDTDADRLLQRVSAALRRSEEPRITTIPIDLDALPANPFEVLTNPPKFPALRSEERPPQTDFPWSAEHLYAILREFKKEAGCACADPSDIRLSVLLKLRELKELKAALVSQGAEARPSAEPLKALIVKLEAKYAMWRGNGCRCETCQLCRTFADELEALLSRPVGDAPTSVKEEQP